MTALEISAIAYSSAKQCTRAPVGKIKINALAFALTKNLNLRNALTVCKILIILRYVHLTRCTHTHHVTGGAERFVQFPERAG